MTYADDLRPVGNRCLITPSIHPFWARFPIETIRHVLQSLGCETIHVPLISLARSSIGASEYVKNPSPAEAPERVDCSSFVKWLYAMLGVWIPRYTAQQCTRGELIDPEALSAGDLVFMSGRFNWPQTSPPIGHVGMATGQGTIIHAAGTERGVVEDPLHNLWEGIRYGRRILPTHAPWITVLFPPSLEIETPEDLTYLAAPFLLQEA